MLRRLALGLAMLSFACGGENSPTAPSTPVVQTPQFPSLIGGWGGTLTIVVVEVGNPNNRLTNTCAQTWIVTTQNGGTFSGTFQSSGGTTTTCAQSGTMTGNVSTTGTISGLGVSVSVGDVSGQCSRTSGDGLFSGVTSGASITAQASDRVRCGAGSISIQGDRSLSLSLMRR